MEKLLKLSGFLWVLCSCCAYACKKIFMPFSEYANSALFPVQNSSSM